MGQMLRSSPLRALLLAAALVPAAGLSTKFTVSYAESAFAGPFTGKVVVYLSKRNPEPRLGPDWFNPEPVLVASFADVKPGQPMTVDTSNNEGSKRLLARAKPGAYYVQAVVDRNLGGRAVGASPGNLYSRPQRIAFDPDSDETVALLCDRTVAREPFVETEHVKELRVPSRLLSEFYKRPTFIEAAVELPREWTQDPNRRFPVVYEVPGFGGSHRSLSGFETLSGCYRDGEPFILVTLNPECPLGHSVFADSANNGPWGKALTEEFIPELERRFRGNGLRFVTGHSSGGWASLWLQVAYPDVFAGCWSTSPDPVDFRSFQGIDIYKPGANMFFDEAGNKRPLARRGSTVLISYQDFSERERGLRGEQLGSFEAVFGPAGPARLWDRDTGAIDPKVAEAWKKYDIGLILRTNWPKLKPKLDGKIFVACGTEDTFYLESAVRLLKKDLEALGAKATVLLLPGDHGSVLTPNLLNRIDREMAAKARAWKAGIMNP